MFPPRRKYLLRGLSDLTSRSYLDLQRASLEIATEEEAPMTRPSQSKVVVHCILSDVAMGCAEQGRIFNVGANGTQRTTFHNLLDGDYLALKLQVCDERRPVSVNLAKVSWVQGERFGVELLMMDADERLRLNRFLEEKLPLELEFQDSHAELTIRAAE